MFTFKLVFMPMFTYFIHVRTGVEVLNFSVKEFCPQLIAVAGAGTFSFGPTILINFPTTGGK
jgi:hypothetical protein